MFRLVKILNGRINQPEPIKIKTTASASYKFGTALSRSAGALVNCAAATKPLYICGEDAKADEKSEITVYAIDPNQIFEVPISEDPDALIVGSKVTLSISDGKATGVTATTTNGVCEIFDLNGAEKANDLVLVKIS